MEVRQLFELEDFAPDEAVERFRDMGIGQNVFENVKVDL